MCWKGGRVENWISVQNWCSYSQRPRIKKTRHARTTGQLALSGIIGGQASQTISLPDAILITVWNAVERFIGANF